jgi:putative DNA methylase
MAASAPRNKLIEVSIPLEAINTASAREKSIRHGHPSTLHLWWARRPLAACRAVLFAQLVDDPSSWPDRFPTEEAQEAERKRLHKVIERLVPWEASSDEAILNEARWEIARSVAWGLGEEPPPKGDGKAILEYLQTKAPPIYDPFSGGGSIPLEAQRLGLRAYGSDLNPVAVLIGKALVEIPPKFAGKPPVNPKAQGELKRGRWNGKGAQGLSEDVRYYGQWMREQAEKRIGHLYPKAKLPDGSEATVIAWLWARTVRSPDPAAKGAMVPLVSSFMLSTKDGKKAWVEPVIDPDAPDGWRFEVRRGKLSKVEEDRLKEGTKTGRGSFACVLTGTAISGDYIKGEGSAGRMGARLMAIVAEGARSRVYLNPAEAHQEIAKDVSEADFDDVVLSKHPQYMGCVPYGLTSVRRLFTLRQLVTLTTFSDLVEAARKRVLNDAAAAGLPPDATRLHNGGTGATAYADAIATYLGFGVSKMSDYSSTIVLWSPTRDQAKSTFARQAIPMAWDFAEINPFADAAGDFSVSTSGIARTLGDLPATSQGDLYRPHLPVAEVADWFSSYVYLPKLRDLVVLQAAIRDSVAKLDPTFGYADGFDEAAGRYRNLTWAKAPSEIMPPSALLVRAAEVLEQLKLDVSSTDAPKDNRGGTSRAGGAPQQADGESVPAAPGYPRRFYGSVDIDMVRPVKAFDAILNAVVMQLQRTQGAKVKLTLEIEAEAPNGFPESEIGLIRDNAKDLKFKPESTGFGE